MKKAVKIKFSKIDLFDFRLGGPGLGNLLFPWARGVIFARKNNIPVLSPNWKTFKIGTYLRSEKDKRTYNDLFVKNGKSGFSKYYNELFLKKFNETDQNFSSSKSGILEFRGMKNQMQNILEDYKIVKEELIKIVNPKWLAIAEKNKPENIAVHIRLGDFQASNEEELRKGKTNTQIPIKWYISTIQKINDQLGTDHQIYLFSDGKKEQLKEILAIENVKLIEGGNAISDMLSLSYAKVLIASNSTFSLWASYLGRCNTIWFPGTLKVKLFEESGDAVEFELDYENQFSTEHSKILN